MKKKVKYAILGAIIFVVVAMLTVSIMRPLTVDVVEIELSHAEIYFTEIGHVRDNRVDVFSLVGGEIISVHVTEGQFVQEGDVLVIVDSGNILHEIEQVRINNLAILAQIDNLSGEEAQIRAGHITNRNVLQSELGAIDAQEQMSLVTDSDRQLVMDENIRLQNIVIEQSRMNVESAYNDVERARILFDAGFISRTEFEAVEQVLENHRISLATNEQTLEIINSEASIVDQSAHFASLRRSIQSQIIGIDNSLDQLSTEPMRRYFNALIESNDLTIANLERLANNSTITSPVSGTVINLGVNYTNILNPAIPVAQIRTEADNLVEVFVSTANINDLSVGDIVDLTSVRQSGDVFYTGTIYSIEDNAEAMVSILGVEERRVKVLIEPDSSSSSFRSGFDIDVRFITYSEQNRISVPRTAIFENGEQSMVYIVENGSAKAVPVTPGVMLRTEVVIESGLNAGDVVIRDARQVGLSHGTRVAW